MVICHALNCQNNSKDKIRLFQFPRDKDRQLLWFQNCGKNDFRPTSKLCEFHFDEAQFEQKRADGRRKLKPNAVPTIFSHLHETIPVPNNNLSDPIPEDNTLINNSTNPASGDHTYFCQTHPKIGDVSSLLEVRTPLEACSSPENQSPTGLNTWTLEEENCRLRSILQSKSVKINELNKANETLKNEVSVRKKQYNQLRKKFKRTHFQYSTLLNKVTKIPIIKHLARETNNPRGRWCPESLKFATQIRYAIGWKAYIYLKKELGIPLPSYSTITRNTNRPYFKTGILHKMVTQMESKQKSHQSSLDCVTLIDEIDIQTSLD